MPKTPNAVLLCAGLLLLAGCSNSQPQNSQADGTAAAAEQTAPAETESAASPTASTETAAAKDTRRIGGEGDEENAETPLPENFVYRFNPDGVAMRLAGGNYQTIAYDFSAAYQTEHDEIPYFIRDYDEDGDLDLFAPIAFSGQTVEKYAVFLWNADTKKFEEQPVFAADSSPAD